MFRAGTLAEEFLDDVEGFHSMAVGCTEQSVIVPRRIYGIIGRLVFLGEPVEQSRHVAQVFRSRHQVSEELFLSSRRGGPGAFEIIGGIFSVPAVKITGLHDHHFFRGIGIVAVGQRAFQRGDVVVPFGIVGEADDVVVKPTEFVVDALCG